MFFVLVWFFSVGKRLNSQSKLADSMSHAKYFISQWLLVSGKIFLLLQGQVTFSGVILSTVLNFVFFSQDGCNFMCRCSESHPTRYKVGCQSEILCLNNINGSRHKGIVSSIRILLTMPLCLEPFILLRHRISLWQPTLYLVGCDSEHRHIKLHPSWEKKTKFKTVLRITPLKVTWPWRSRKIFPETSNHWEIKYFAWDMLSANLDWLFSRFPTEKNQTKTKNKLK